MEAERLRIANLNQAIEIERASSKKFQDALESERRRTRDLSNRSHESAEDLRKQVLDLRHKKTELEVALEREKIFTSNLEAELETERALKSDASGM